MKQAISMFLLLAALTGCANLASPEAPVAVQGSNDVQGSPIYSGPNPGLQIGGGAGAVSGASGAGVGGRLGF